MGIVQFPLMGIVVSFNGNYSFSSWECSFLFVGTTVPLQLIT